MKKLIIALALAILLVLAFASLTSANGGPHGGYTATTDACAGCHRAHTAAGPNLLIEANTYDLCISCHGNTQTGAVTNVVDGVLEATAGDNTGTALNGGGFAFFKGTSVTSTHDVSSTVANAWGNGASARGAASAMSGGGFLNCASCHDPHGSTNYRIIKTTVNSIGTTVTQVDEGAQIYDAESWPSDMSGVCVSCHNAYHDNGLVKDATSYTHNVDVAWNAGGLTSNPELVPWGGFTLPLSEPVAGIEDYVTCNTCHLSHGSSAQMGGIADGGPLGTGSIPGDTTATDSALLRLDNRGVCEVCHRKGTGSAFPVLVITSPAEGDTLGAATDFTSTVSDVEDGAALDETDTVWTDSVELALGTGDLAAFDTSGWTSGAHVVTATVTDSDGNVTTLSINVTVP